MRDPLSDVPSDHLRTMCRPTLASALMAVLAAGAGCGDVSVIEGIEPATTKLVGAAARPIRNMAVMMFDISGGAPNAATLQTLIFDGPTSMKKMYQEISNGMQDVQGDLLGPYQLPVPNCLTIACCGPSSDRTGNGATVAQLIAALPKTYDHYFWAYGTPLPAGANCGTWGDEGAPDNIAKYSSYSFHQLVGYTQEVGHNFGMTHESTMSCNGMTMPDDPSTCTHNEYGNQLTFMGGGGHHPSAHHKAHQGWLSKCNVVNVGASAQFTLLPQEVPCDGVQLLQIPAPKVRTSPNGSRLSNYYVEMRGPYGAFDKNIAAMVTISIGDDFHTTRQNAPYVYLLDVTPATTTQNDAGLKTVGQSYSDPAGGVTITLNALDNMSATVTVTTAGTGGFTCRDQTVFTPPGLGPTSCNFTGIGGPVGTGGATGTGGRAGTGGATGAGGRAGTGGAGTGGRGGGSASGGATGTGGTTGTGTGGAIVAGSGGSPASTGGAGVPPGGGIDGGIGKDGGGTGPGATPSDVSGGCACEVSPSSKSGRPAIALLLLVGGIALFRRRRSP